MRIKVDSKKGICPDFVRNVLYDCRYDHDELLLVDPSMNIPPCQLQEMLCLSRVLICMEFIIQLTESACPSFLLNNLDPFLCKISEDISDINVRLEAIIFEE